VKAALPLTLKIGLLLLSKAAHPTVSPLCGEVAIEPVVNLVPDYFLVSREAKIHAPNYGRQPALPSLVV
jgi:hypothetical protein